MVSFILLAAGKGSRTEKKLPKQYASIAGKPLLLHVLDKISKIDEIRQLIICCEEQYKPLIEKMAANNFPDFSYQFAKGGNTRQQSVWNGLKMCENETVIIHEAARPFVKREEFLRLLNDSSANVIYGSEIPFTVLSGKEFVEGILNRNELLNIQLPQKFSASALRKAHAKACENEQEFTEDASLLFTYSDEKIKVLKGSSYNIKITYPIDFLIGEVIYKEYIAGREGGR